MAGSGGPLRGDFDGIADWRADRRGALEREYRAWGSAKTRRNLWRLASALISEAEAVLELAGPCERKLARWFVIAEQDVGDSFAFRTGEPRRDNCVGIVKDGIQN